MKRKNENMHFNTNKNDIGALTTRAVLGAIPFAGSALSEIVGSIIPDQRMDRVAVYLEKLQSILDDQTFEKIKSLPDKVAMIEEGMFAVGLTPHQDRIERITHVIANGLEKEKIKADKVSKLLFAAKNISDFDAVVLQSYKLWGKNLNDYSTALSFQKKHPQIWPSIKDSPFDEESNLEEYEKSKKAYEEANEHALSSARHLAALSLLKPHKPNIYSDDSDGLKGTVERLSSAVSEEEYCITDFGLHALDAMRNPKEALVA